MASEWPGTPEGCLHGPQQSLLLSLPPEAGDNHDGEQPVRHLVKGHLGMPLQMASQRSHPAMRCGPSVVYSRVGDSIGLSGGWAPHSLTKALPYHSTAAHRGDQQSRLRSALRLCARTLKVRGGAGQACPVDCLKGTLPPTRAPFCPVDCLKGT